ncbi:DUF2971 domain-containing protein [Piscirickettsia litoralis]|uniref:DUF2971 domain-containing protein n=1 Tax=Piscirickettsia litoralis TaxID=1891921 RepID=A0ABX2ZXQ7_9GAMM|nr:DUF2971 domain-containing protein [Piscirickettsia litoralis]ODN41357.1 hypothetical protein BGC07_16430 [Piscirickettsia litoralis]
MKDSYEKSHNLYKYLDVEGARKTLIGQSFLYSVPEEFNDPFDCDLKIPMTGEANDLKIFSNQISKWLSGQSSPFNNPSDSEMKTHICNEWQRLRNLNRKERLKELSSNKKTVEAKWINYLKKMISSQLEHYQTMSKRGRVLCLSSCNDNILMWSHYADHHKGIVIEVQPTSKVPNLISLAQRVSYENEFPKPLSYKKFAESWLTWDEKVIAKSSENLYKSFVLTKSNDWGYENEWRIIHSLREEDDSRCGAVLIPFKSEVIKSVYFGCRTSDLDKKSIKLILNQMHPHVKMYEMQKSESNFSLIPKIVNCTVAAVA